MTPLPAGVEIGHWDDPVARTGCTVVLLPPGTVASGEVRGDAPASRELAFLDPTRTVQHADAVVMTGGSAFGLSVADGVMAWLVEHERGYETDGGRVPIVPTMALYDLAIGEPGPDGLTTRRPGPAEGRAACDAATSTPATGQVGAGCGATVRKWLEEDDRRDGGLAIATRELDDVRVTAVAAVNALGDVTERAEADLAAGRAPSGRLFLRTNTTLVTILTDAALDKVACHAVARSGHDGLARALLPVHTAGDGDAVVVAATGTVDAPSELVRMLAVLAVEDAVRAAVV
ncbi:MAG: P1 family peptidase [Actinomycetota bacterium]